MADRDANLPRLARWCVGGPDEFDESNCQGSVLRDRQSDAAAARLHQESATDATAGHRACSTTQAPVGESEVTRKKHIGSSFDDFLAEEGLLAGVNAAARKRVLAWQIERAMKQRRISKAELARKMRTSRSALDRLLDPKNPSVTLATM